MIFDVPSRLGFGSEMMRAASRRHCASKFEELGIRRFRAAGSAQSVNRDEWLLLKRPEHCRSAPTGRAVEYNTEDRTF